MKTIVKLMVGAAVGIAAVAGIAGPASAAQTNCTKTNELCTVSVNVSGARSVVFATHFSGVSGKAQYNIYNASGKNLCVGSIGYNNSGSCTFPSVYTGKVSFQFAKGNSKAGAVTISEPN